jgi:hypothetical protein
MIKENISMNNLNKGSLLSVKSSKWKLSVILCLVLKDYSDLIEDTCDCQKGMLWSINALSKSI